MELGLEEKVVLITGANHGIGAATARAFAAQGAPVLLQYLRLSPEAYGVTAAEAGQARAPGEAFYRAQQARSADAVVDAIRALGGEAEAWEANMSAVDTSCRCDAVAANRAFPKRGANEDGSAYRRTAWE